MDLMDNMDMMDCMDGSGPVSNSSGAFSGQPAHSDPVQIVQ